MDFSIPHLDIRWIGGKSDYNETTQVGTDNADVFAKAIDLIGKYYNGLSIMIIGQYYIGKNVSFCMILIFRENITIVEIC